MKRKLALLPMDFRPYTYEVPQQIASIADWEVIVPEKHLLSFLKKPGDIEALQQWLLKVSSDVDGLIISIDTLAYGGLIPSRVCEDDLEEIIDRISILKQLSQLTNKKIMAFSTTMRISNSYVNEQEKTYWNKYGKDIWKYSYHSHRYQETGDMESDNIIKHLEEIIPQSILNDYLQTRKRNFQVNKYLLDYVEEGIIDFLSFPQDDTAPFGFNIQEQKEIIQEIDNRFLHSKVYVYPGADEVAITLTGRIICELEKIKTPIFYMFFSGETGALQPAMYEDRPIIESVKAQVFAMGGYTVETSIEADISLAVNTPGRLQGDIALQQNLEGVDTGDRNIGEWLKRIEHYLDKGRNVAIADVAYANGADKAMVPRLLEQRLFERLIGFAGWNTAGNTLGTVIPQATMAYVAEKRQVQPQNKVKREILHQLLTRLLSDYLYLSVTRQNVKDILKSKNPTSEELLTTVQNIFEKDLQDLINKLLPVQLNGYKWEVNKVYLPWERLFEVGLEISVENHQ